MLRLSVLAAVLHTRAVCSDSLIHMRDRGAFIESKVIRLFDAKDLDQFSGAYRIISFSFVQCEHGFS